MVIEVIIPLYEKKNARELIMDCCGVSWYDSEELQLSRSNYDDVCLLEFWHEEDAEAAYMSILDAAETGRTAHITVRDMEFIDEDDE